MEFNDKKIQIMEAAEALFAEQGFNGTSVRDIAEKAQVNLAMISYYFGSKEKLLEAIFTYRGEYIKIKLETLLQQAGLSSMEKMYAMIDHYVEKIMSQQCFHKIMAREQVFDNTGLITKLILQIKKTNLDLVGKIIHEGQKKGEFRKNIDIPLMMTTLVGTANNMITTKHYYKELSNLQSLTEEEFQKHIKKRLGQHLKSLFKTILTHEA